MTLSTRFEEALTYAFNLHANQVRKGTGVPYFSHLMAVCSIALEHGANEDEAIAALLHDAIEDQGGAKIREEIRLNFGDMVASIVDGCTDADVMPKPPWRNRKETYLEHLRVAPASVRLISASDKLHNARAVLLDYRVVGDELWSRFNGGKEGTLWYYRALANIYAQVGPAILAEEINRVVAEIEELAGASSSGNTR